MFAPNSRKSLINTQKVKVTFEDNSHIVIHVDSEHKFEVLEAFERYLDSEGIPFDVWEDAWHDLNPTLVCHRPGQEPQTYTTGVEGESMISRTEFEKIMQTASTKEELIEQIKKRFPEYADPLPPLKVC